MGAIGRNSRDEEGLTLVSSPLCVALTLTTMVMLTYQKYR